MGFLYQAYVYLSYNSRRKVSLYNFTYAFCISRMRVFLAEDDLEIKFRRELHILEREERQQRVRSLVFLRVYRVCLT